MMKPIFYILFLVVVVSACEKQGPEEVLRQYLTYISTSKCEHARDLCTDMAKDFVQGLIDMGCIPYESTIHSITCRVEADTALCECDETNQYGRFLLNYNLIRIEGDWKVHIEAQTEAQTME
jgi:hypothetical protein